MVDDNLHRVSVQPSLNLNKFKSQQKKKIPTGDSALMAFQMKGFIAPIRPWAVMFYSKVFTVSHCKNMWPIQG